MCLLYAENARKLYNVSLGYETGIVAEGLDFTVSRGDYLCILGENGSGKSTLVKTLLGLHHASSGKITRNVSGIGYLPQQTVVQRDFPASVREIVRSGCLSKCGFRPFYKKAERDRAEQNMQRLGIADLSRRCYRALSGGQQQRVLLARALCAADSMMLLDEPVTGLDPKAQMDLYELIAKLNRDGITIIMVSHDVRASVQYASHICRSVQKSSFSLVRRKLIGRAKSGRHFWRQEVRMMDALQTLVDYFVQYPFIRYAFAVGLLIALCSSLLGVTLVLKRFSFIGDGLSHVAFGAMAVATITGLTNKMVIILPVTLLSAVLLLGRSNHRGMRNPLCRPNRQWMYRIRRMEITMLT